MLKSSCSALLLLRAIQIVWRGRTLTLIMSTHRKIPAIMTNTPPPKMPISEIFVFTGNCALHSIGMGIDIRYKSVITFSTTVT